MPSIRAQIPLPRRSRTHELEQASRRAFASALPNHWAESQPDHDYGVDLDIEVFPNGRAVGATLGAQLKAVERIKTHPAASIKVSTYNYWMMQKRPVLLVLHDHETNDIWALFAHHIDASKIKDGAKSFTVRFGEEDRWSEARARQIEKEVMARHSWDSIRAELPLTITCLGTGSLAGVSAGIVIRNVRSILRRHPELFSSRPATGVRMRVRASDSKVVLSVDGGRDETLFVEAQSPNFSAQNEQATIDDLTQRVVYLVATQLQQIGLAPEAAKLIRSYVEEDSPSMDAEVVTYFISIMALGGERSAAIDLLEQAFQDDFDSSSPIQLGLMLAKLRPNEVAAYAEALRGWAVAATNAGERAVRAYNAAIASRDHSLDSALELYDLAAESDPAYAKRPYWQRERAGVLFLMGRFTEAVAGYRQALALGSEGLTSMLLADSLLFAGEYANAMQQMAGFDADLPEFAEYRVKHYAFSHIFDSLEVELQERDSHSAMSLMTDAEDITQSVVLAALRRDALCPAALFEYGVLLHEQGEPCADWFLACALAAPGEPEPWRLAISTTGLEARALLEDVVSCARRMAGESLLDYLFDTEPEFAEIVHEMFAGVEDDEDDEITLRRVEPGAANPLGELRFRKGGFNNWGAV